MKKNYYAKVLALTVAASMVSVPAFAEEGDGTAVATLQAESEATVIPATTENETEKTIPEAGGNLESGTYKLTEDVMLTDANLTIPVDEEVTIDLNGNMLTGNGLGSVIRVYGKLTILDSGNDGKITGGFKKYTNKWINNVEHDGGGIFVDTDAEVILESGSITGNDAWNGGGVYVNGGGSFTMNGGEISNNRTLRSYHGGGGGIYVLDDETNGTGRFVMNDGVIKGNTTLTQGGGAFIDGVMEMNGGKIIDNTGLKGGGVCINGTMTLNDGVVSGNKAEFLEGTEYDAIECDGIKINGGTLNLNGGEITDNTAISTEETNAKDEEVEDAVAAGIYNIGTLNVSGAPVVSGNTTDDKAQNIYLSSGRVITLSDSLDVAAKLYTTLDSETGRATDTDGYTAPEGTILSDKEGLTVETHKGDIYFFKDVPVENAVCFTWIDDKRVYHENLAAAVASLPSDDNVVTILNDCELTSQVGVTAGVEAILTSETPVSITWKDADKAFFYINEDAALSLQGPITVQGNYTNVGNEVSGNTDLYAFDVRGTLNIGERGIEDSDSPTVKNFNTVTVSSNKPSSGYGAIQANGGTVNLYSGILEGNTAYLGGAIYATNTAAVNLIGGEITGNYACYGGGLYVTTPTVVTLTGGKITENTAASGGGVYVASSTAGGEELHLSGSPYIANNTATKSDSDVLLSGTSKGSNTTFPARVITLDGALTSGAHIGVQRADSTTVIAKAADGYTITDNDAAYFAHSGNKLVQKDATENQLVLAEKDGTYHTVTINLPDHVKADRALTAQVADDGAYEVTLTAEKGYKISSVTVGEEEKTLVDGKLTLESISADTTITVTEEEKAAPTLTLSSNSGMFRINRGPVTFTYTYDGDGKVTVASSDENVATASVDTDKKVVTVTLKAVGTAKITVSAAEGDNFLAKDATYGLTVQKKKSSSSSSATTTDKDKDNNKTIDNDKTTDNNQAKDDNSAAEKSKVIKLQIGSRIVNVDNEAVIYDTAPVIRNDRTLVPIRIVTETLGGKVDWNGVTKEVTLHIDGKEIKMTVGKTLEKYGVAPVIIDGRTFVPVRFVADELGATVAWDDATKTVTITKIEK